MHVVVVGAGIAGASCALALAERGARVTVVDDALAGRATAAGAGAISPWTSARASDAYTDLAVAAADAYPGIVERIDGEVSYARVGTLLLPSEEHDARAIAARVRDRARRWHGAGDIEVLDERAALERVPVIDASRGAVWVSSGARVDGARLAHATLATARRLGVSERTGTAHLDHYGRVLVDGTAIEADAVVVAAGAWTDGVLAATGMRLGVEPQRGQLLHLRTTHATAAWPVVVPDADHYVVSFADRVVIGATRETGSGFAPEVTAAGLDRVRADAWSIAPGLRDAVEIEARVGLRPMSPDGLPIVGRLAERLWVATGFGAGGLNVAPFAGRELADRVLGESGTIDWSPFDPARAVHRGTAPPSLHS